MSKLRAEAGRCSERLRRPRPDCGGDVRRQAIDSEDILAAASQSGDLRMHFYAASTIRLALQQPTRVRRNVATIKAGHHRTPRNHFKFEQLRRALCWHRGRRRIR